MQEKIKKLREFKLLFVEDEEDLIKIISDTLNKLQANFVTARDGEEALKIFKENDDIEVVVTDINMPIMNGLELIEHIKKINDKIPIVIMSAHTESEYINSAKELGVEHYLLKPFDFIKFINLMATLNKKGQD